jgi:hypothetical protein
MNDRESNGVRHAAPARKRDGMPISSRSAIALTIEVLPGRIFAAALD